MRGEDSSSRPARRVGLLIYSNAWGGMELHTEALARVLVERGHDVVIAELGEPRLARRSDLNALPGIRFASGNLGRSFQDAGFLRWYSFLRRLNCDVGVLAKGWPAVGSVSLDFAARFSCRRFMTIEHNTPPPRPLFRRSRHFGGLLPGLGLYWYRQMGALYSRSLAPQRIVGVSRAVTRELAAYGFPERKLVPVPNGVDAAQYRPNAGNRAAMRSAWGVPEGALLFGMVGRLDSHQKQPDVALTLLARLLERHPIREFRCVLVGDGPDRERLEAQASELGLGERVTFAGHTDRPWEAHSAIDVFLSTSRFEGIGLSLMEAMASGSCPIAMGVGGVAEVICNPTLGWLIPPGDQDAFLEAMGDALMMGAEARRAMGSRAREHIARNFRADEQFAKIADLIEQI